MKRYTVKFRYADDFSYWEWRTQSCSVCADNEDDAVKECVKIYGLSSGCMYGIISVEEEG